MTPHYLPNPSPMPGSWVREAACQDTDPNLFFPDAKNATEEAAKDICFGCPVMGDCLDYAMRTRQFGIWGGTNDRERRNLRARRRKLAQQVGGRSS